MNRHVLVVDDEPDVTDLFQAFLALRGYRTSVAASGEAALALHDRDPADALVTDLSMPGMGGRELARRIREGSPRLPVIFVSGFPGDWQPAAAFTVVLVKPVSMKTLGDRLDALIADADTAARF